MSVCRCCIYLHIRCSLSCSKIVRVSTSRNKTHQQTAESYISLVFYPASRAPASFNYHSLRSNQIRKTRNRSILFFASSSLSLRMELTPSHTWAEKYSTYFHIPHFYAISIIILIKNKNKQERRREVKINSLARYFSLFD